MWILENSVLQGDAITTAVFIVQLGHKHHLIQGRPGLSGVCGVFGAFLFLS